MPQAAGPSSAVTGTLYPAYAHRAHPLHKTWVKITAAVLAKLHQPDAYRGQAIYFYNNHPLQYVALAGPIVGVEDDDKRRFVEFYIDDSSGAVATVFCPRAGDLPGQNQGSRQRDVTHGSKQINADYPWSENIIRGLILSSSAIWMGRSEHGKRLIDLRPVQVGQVVLVKGTLGRFRQTMQVKLESLEIAGDLGTEISFWNQTHDKWQNILAAPWELTDRELKKYRRDAERAQKRQLDSVNATDEGDGRNSHRKRRVLSTAVAVKDDQSGERHEVGADKTSLRLETDRFVDPDQQRGDESGDGAHLRHANKDAKALCSESGCGVDCHTNTDYRAKSKHSDLSNDARDTEAQIGLESPVSKLMAVNVPAEWDAADEILLFDDFSSHRRALPRPESGRDQPE